MAVQAGYLKRIVVVIAAVRFVVNLRKTSTELSDTGSSASRWVLGHTYNLVCDGTQEQVTALAADVPKVSTVGSGNCCCTENE
jgi:predicted histidine transporter YuiF (NhaC family)